MSVRFWNTIYRIYRRRIFPSIRGIRGATRVQNFLRDRAVKYLEEVSEDQMTNVLEREWDNLIILDACRYDLFEEFIEEYQADSIYSVGSSSSEFIRETFSDADLKDVVLLTANPHFHTSQFQDLVGKKPEEVFYTVYHLYETHWSETEGTVVPKDVNKAALSAKKLFPDKKLIIWYMQPHFPFLNSDVAGAPLGTEAQDECIRSVWGRASAGKISREKLWREYGKNLDIVFEKVVELDKKLEGKTVVTSDHGNLVGEANLFGHPTALPVKSLHKVPWLEL